MIQLFLFFAFVVAALAVTFALQNTTVVTVSFLVWSFSGSLALVLFVALAAGALVGWLVTMPSVLRARLTVVSQRRNLSALESSVAQQKQQLDERQKPVTTPAPADAPTALPPTPSEKSS